MSDTITILLSQFNHMCKEIEELRSKVATSNVADAPTLNAIIIPDNATNLDVIKMLFSNTEVVNKGFHNVTLSFGSLLNQMFDNHYDEDWLNEPYKG